MDPQSNRPQHQPETMFIGKLQVFEGESLSPDDPEFKARERKRRPSDTRPRGDDEQKELRPGE